MKSISLQQYHLEVGVRRAARTLAAFVLALILVPIVVNSIYDVVHGFYDGEMPHSLKITGLEAMQAMFIWAVCIGLVVAWRWATIGGVISVAGMILFFALAFVGNGGLPGGLSST
jgi:hypothetical protein